MAAALDNGGGRNDGQAGFFLQLGDGERTAVAHGRAHLVQRRLHAVGQGAGVGHVGIDALLKAQLLGAAQVVALPVAGAVGALAPVFLDVVAADAQLVRRGLVEAGEVAAQHNEVRTHGQRQRDVVILHDAAVGADGDVDAGLLVVLVAGLGDLNDRRSLTASDALSLAGDADGAAADADLDEVCAGLGQEQEALAVNDVACADLHLVAVVLTDPGDGAGLPLAEALGGVDAEHIHTGLYQRGHALGEVAGVDAAPTM